jgi:hypothetical protein
MHQIKSALEIFGPGVLDGVNAKLDPRRRVAQEVDWRNVGANIGIAILSRKRGLEILQPYACFNTQLLVSV